MLLYNMFICICVCVAGSPGLCGAALWFSAVSSVLAAPVIALALPLPTDRCGAQVLWQVRAVGAGRSAAAEPDERLVRDGSVCEVHGMPSKASATCMNINIGSLDAEYVVVCVVGLWVWRLSTVCWRPDCVRISTCARISSLCCSGRPVWAALKASLHCCRPPLEGCERPWRLRVRVAALSQQQIKKMLMFWCYIAVLKPL